MTYYKYESVGVSMTQRKRKACFLHEKCATALNQTIGPDATITDEIPSKDDICAWCQKGFTVTEESE